MRAFFILAAGYALVGSAYAQLVPAGPEFALGTYTTSDPYVQILSGSPKAAAGPTGDFVVVWSRVTLRGGQTNTVDVFGQRFDAAGTPLGEEFRVNSRAAEGADVAVQSTGEFVVVWDGYGGYGAYGARFDAARLGTEFSVTGGSDYFAGGATVAADPMGGFVVVWSNEIRDSELLAQRYDAGGSPVGAEFVVNTYTTGTQAGPAVAFEPSGGFVVVWASFPQGYPQPAGVKGVFGQRYDAAGAPLGGEFAVNAYTTGYQLGPRVASDPAGGFVVVWSSEDSNDSARVSGRRFDAGGSPVGGEFAIGSYTTYRQIEPDVAVDPTGGFLVVWSNWAPTTPYSRAIVLGQQYDAGGVPVGGELTFAPHGPFSSAPSVAADPAGGFVVAREVGYYPEDRPSRVFGQRLVPAGTPDANIAPDADFESDPASFYFGRGPCSFTWADDAAHSATHALRIDSQTRELCRWLSETSTIPVNPGESYDVSAWMRTDGSQPAGVLSVKFWTAAGVHVPGTVYAPLALSGPHDWTLLRLSATAPPDAAFLRIELRLNGPGTLWADDVRVTAGIPVAKSPPVVKGLLEAGQTVKTTLGSWTGSPTDFQVQWIACSYGEEEDPRSQSVHPPVCEEISSATGTTYTLTAAEIDRSIQTVVRATGFGRTGEAFSDRRGVVLEATPSSGNLARDVDVELNPAPYYFTNGPCFFQWTSQEAHSSTHALRIFSDTTALCRWFTKPTLIAVEPGARYTVSAWFRTEDVHGNARLGLNFWTKAREYITPTILSDRIVKGTQDWTKLVAQAKAPADAAYVRVELRLNGPGEVFVDDLSVTR